MRRSEKGRSMVEMLGVLAIIGVLSVGGIYGYTVAMNKYKANEVAQAMSMYATMALAANGGDGNKDLTAKDAGVADDNNQVEGCTLSITEITNAGVAKVKAVCPNEGIRNALSSLVKDNSSINYSVTAS